MRVHAEILMQNIAEGVVSCLERATSTMNGIKQNAYYIKSY